MTASPSRVDQDSNIRYGGNTLLHKQLWTRIDKRCFIHSHVLHGGRFSLKSRVRFSKYMQFYIQPLCGRAPIPYFSCVSSVHFTNPLQSLHWCTVPNPLTPLISSSFTSIVVSALHIKLCLIKSIQCLICAGAVCDGISE